MSKWPYNTQRWQRLRRLQLARHPLCRTCVPEGRLTDAIEVDHIKRIEDGGDVWSTDNLQSLCTPCHSTKTNYDMRGKDWEQHADRGCFPDGSPRDPAHPWYRGEPGKRT